MVLASTNRIFHVTAALLAGLFVCFLAPAQADDNAGANQRLVEAVGYLQQADTLWASEPWTEGATLKEFLSLATFVPGSYHRLIASRPTSQVAAMTLAFERVAALFQKALDLLKSIPATYPSSNLAVTLITGQSVGDVSIPDLEEKLAALHYLINAASQSLPRSPSEAGTPPAAKSPLPDPQAVQACVDDPDFTKPDCLATFAYEARKKLGSDRDIAMALAHIAAAYRAAGQEQAFTDTFNSAKDILETELADVRQNQDHRQEASVLAIVAAAHGLSGHEPQAYDQAISDLVQAVRAVPSPSERDEAVVTGISLITSWGLFAEEVISLADDIHDPAQRLSILNVLIARHVANGNLGLALAAADKALAYAEANADTVRPRSFLITAAAVYALSTEITPEADKAITAIASLDLHNTALYILTATHAGTGNIDAARASLARIPEEQDRLRILHVIAKAQTRAGDYKEARSTLKPIHSHNHKVQELTHVALAQTGALPPVASAPRPGRRHLSDLQNRALGHIVRAHLAARNPEAAQEAANLMSDRSARNELLSQTARLQEQTDAASQARRHLESGDFSAALVSAQVITDASLRDPLLQQIARRQLQTGHPHEARTTAALIGAHNARAPLIPEIARGFVQAGHFDAALETAHSIEDTSARDQVYSHIAQAQLNAKDLDAALATAERIGNVPQKDTIRSAVADHHLQAQDLAGALRVTRTIEQTAARDRHLQEIAKGQIAAGDLAAASATAELIHGADKRNALKNSLTILHIQGGRLDEAAAIAKTIDDEELHDERLGEIAKAQLSAGDVQAAHVTRDLIGHDYNGLSNLSNDIFWAYLNLEDLDSALALAKSTKDSSTQDSRLSSVAQAHINDKDLETARAIAELMTPSGVSQRNMLHSLFWAYMNNKDLEPALDIAKTYKDPYQRDQKLDAVAAGHWQKGDYDTAHALIQLMTRADFQRGAINKLVMALVQSGNPDRAATLVVDLKEHEHYESRVEEIARAQMYAGDYDAALSTADLMATEAARNELKDEIRAYQQAQQ